MNTKMMTIAAGLVSLTTWAQGLVPAPIPQPVAPAPVASVAAAVLDSQDDAPGAICHVYPCNRMANIAKTTAREQGYDMDNETFSARDIVNGECGGSCYAVWEGSFVAKKAGEYTFKLTNFSGTNASLDIQLEVNGMKVVGEGTADLKVLLKQGFNAFKLTGELARSSSGYSSVKVSYRLSTSMLPAKNLAPSMIRHPIVDDDDF